MFKKLNNLKNAADDDYSTWQRVLMALGWSNWDVAPDLSKQKSKESKKEGSKKKDKNKKSTIRKKYGDYSF